MNSKLPQKNKKKPKQPAKRVEAEIVAAVDEVDNEADHEFDDVPPLPPPLSLFLPLQVSTVASACHHSTYASVHHTHLSYQCAQLNSCHYQHNFHCLIPNSCQV